MARLDLDQFFPDDHVVVFRGQELKLPGEIGMQVVLEATRLQGKLPDAETTEEMSKILERMYDIVMELLRERQPDLPDLRLTPREIGMVIGFATSNHEEQTSLELAVIEGLTGEPQATDAEREAEVAAGGTAERRPPTSRKRATKPRSQSAKP